MNILQVCLRFSVDLCSWFKGRSGQRETPGKDGSPGQGRGREVLGPLMEKQWFYALDEEVVIRFPCLLVLHY